MSGNPIIFISFSIAPEKENSFRQYFQHLYLPELLKAVPEVLSVRRYEEICGLGSQNWYTRWFLTVLELKHDAQIQSLNDSIEDRLPKQCKDEYEGWKVNHLRSYHQAGYRQRWAHERTTGDGSFGGRPFFFWANELRPDLDAAVTAWYEDEYLPMHMADVPSWAACRRYESLGLGSTRYLTFYEAADEAALIRCTDEMRSPVRDHENEIWREKFSPAVAWQYVGSFRQIYRRPG